MDEKERHPLDPIEGETAKANAALLDYYNLGPGRRLIILASRYQERYALAETQDDVPLPPTKSIDTIKGWSTRHHWQQRVAEAQVHEQLTREQEDAKLWAARRAEIRQRDFDTGRRIREVVDQTLEQLPNFIKTKRRIIPGQDGQPDREIITMSIKEHALLRGAELSSKLERAGAGMEEATIKHTGTGESGEIVIQYVTNIGEDDL